jgi:hypothetical protein
MGVPLAQSRITGMRQHLVNSPADHNVTAQEQPNDGRRLRLR